MKKPATNPEDGAPKHRKPDLLESFDRKLDSAAHAMEELAEAVAVLPRVDKDGSSECPFAEQLYRQKEEAHLEAQGELNDLEELLRAVDQEIGRCRKNLVRLGQGEGNIKSPETRNRYSGATAAQGTQYKKALEQRKRVLDLIEALKALLRESAQERYPGMDPENPPDIEPELPVPLPPSVVPPRHQAPRPPLAPPPVSSPPPMAPPSPALPAPPVPPPGLPGM